MTNPETGSNGKRLVVDENSPLWKEREHSEIRLNDPVRALGEAGFLRRNAAERELPTLLMANRPEHADRIKLLQGIVDHPFAAETKFINESAARHGLPYINNLWQVMIAFAGSTQDPELLAQVIQCCKNPATGEMESAYMVESLGSMPNGFLEAFFSFHRDRLADLYATLEPELEKQRSEFKERTRKLVESGYLHPDTDLYRLDTRVDSMRWKLIDPLDLSNTTVAGSWSKGVVVKIDGTRPADSLRGTTFHELVHGGVAGRKMTAITEREGYIDAVYQTKNGLRFVFRAEGVPTTRWVWLSEALTETIAARIGGFDPVAYPEERAAFQQLLDEGQRRGYDREQLEREFVHAYQEDYLIETKSAPRLPRMKIILARIRELMGSEWLREQERRFANPTDTI